MTIEQAFAFGLMGATVALFVWGQLRYDLIALAALVAGALVGIIPVDEMFSGFANELIWIIASALLLSAAIARSGVMSAQAAYEVVETIPEAVMQTMGFEGVPVLVVVAYWLALTAAVFFTFKGK